MQYQDLVPILLSGVPLWRLLNPTCSIKHQASSIYSIHSIESIEHRGVQYTYPFAFVRVLKLNSCKYSIFRFGYVFRTYIVRDVSDIASRQCNIVPCCYIFPFELWIEHISECIRFVSFRAAYCFLFCSTLFYSVLFCYVLFCSVRFHARPPWQKIAKNNRHAMAMAMAMGKWV